MVSYATVLGHGVLKRYGIVVVLVILKQKNHAVYENSTTFTPMWSVPLRPNIARTALGNVKGIQNGLKGLEFLWPGIVPNDFAYGFVTVQEFKVPKSPI